MIPQCPICKKEYEELDPTGPEQVNNPMYTPDCECEGEQDEIQEDSTSMEEKLEALN